MARSYYDEGLPEKAKEFLKENIEMIPDIVCPKCGELISSKPNQQTYKFIDVFYGDGPALQEYRLKHGVVREKVQAMPWSGGPVCFRMLVDNDNNVLFKWPQKEINKI